jgi:hypothetical protein
MHTRRASDVLVMIASALSLACEGLDADGAPAPDEGEVEQRQAALISCFPATGLVSPDRVLARSSSYQHHGEPDRATTLWSSALDWGLARKLGFDLNVRGRARAFRSDPVYMASTAGYLRFDLPPAACERTMEWEAFLDLRIPEGVTIEARDSYLRIDYVVQSQADGTSPTPGSPHSGAAGWTWVTPSWLTPWGRNWVRASDVLAGRFSVPASRLSSVFVGAAALASARGNRAACIGDCALGGLDMASLTIEDPVCPPAIDCSAIQSGLKIRYWFTPAGVDLMALWSLVGHAHGVTALAGLGQRLYATTQDNSLVVAATNGLDQGWRRIGHANNVVALTIARNRLFAATTDDRLWTRGLIEEDVPWQELPRHQFGGRIVALGAIGDTLFAATSEHALLSRDAANDAAQWLWAGNAAGTKALAGVSGRLFAVTQTGRLRWLPGTRQWFDQGAAHGVTALASATFGHTSIYAATADGRLLRR